MRLQPAIFGLKIIGWVLSINLEELEADHLLLSSSRGLMHPMCQVVSCFRKKLGPLGLAVRDRVRPHFGYMGVCLVLGYSLSLIMKHFGIFQQGPQDSTKTSQQAFLSLWWTYGRTFSTSRTRTFRSRTGSVQYQIGSTLTLFVNTLSTNNSILVPCSRLPSKIAP